MAIHLKRAIWPTPQPHRHLNPGVSQPSYEGPYNIKQIAWSPCTQNVVLGQQGEFCMRILNRSCVGRAWLMRTADTMETLQCSRSGD